MVHWAGRPIPIREIPDRDREISERRLEGWKLEELSSHYQLTLRHICRIVPNIHLKVTAEALHDPRKHHKWED